MSLYSQLKAGLVRLLRIIPAFDWRYAQYEVGAKCLAEHDQSSEADPGEEEEESLAGNTFPAGHYYSPVPEQKAA